MTIPRGTATIVILMAILAVMLFIIFTLPLMMDVYGQQNVTLTTQTSPTPVVSTTEPIATEQDVFNQFLAGLGTTVVAAGGGVGALWAKIRGKTKRIDQALRGTDFDHRDLIEVLNSFFEAAKKDKTKTPGQLLDEMAYKDKILLEKTIAVAWATEYEEYMEWFNQRYQINKE